MKLPYQQLQTHLAKQLLPFYFISGDDFLLVQEAADSIRAAARKAGYSERVTVPVDSGSDWSKALYSGSHSLSLFATKRIVELHLAGTKLNATNSKVLQEIANNPVTDTITIISSNKIDSKAEQTSWYKSLDKTGAMIAIWPIPMEQLPNWISQRAKLNGLTIPLDAAKRLAELVEGNLFAAAQEIEKLSLLHPQGKISDTIIEDAVADNAHFDLFVLVDAALAGNSKRCIRILENLQAEDTEPLLILWALAREIRTLASIADQQAKGTPLASLFAKYRIWEKRQPAVRRFLQQHKVKSCWSLLADSIALDRMMKGAARGNPWQALQQFVLAMTGNAILLTDSPTY